MIDEGDKLKTGLLEENSTENVQRLQRDVEKEADRATLTVRNIILRASLSLDHGERQLTTPFHKPARTTDIISSSIIEGGESGAGVVR